MDRSKSFSLFNLISLVFGLVFLYLPVLLVVIYSFNDSKLVTVWGGWSLRWYQAFFQHSALLDAFAITIKVALISATLAVLGGLMLAVVIVRHGKKSYSPLLKIAVAMPVVLPEIVIGLIMANSFAMLGLSRGLITLVTAHTIFSSCFVAMLIASRLRNLDLSLEEAAVDLGCTPVQAFRQVTLPTITSSLVAGWILALTLSFDDLIIASFTSGSGAVTLPIQVYSQIRLGVTPVVNVLSTIFLVTVMLMLCLCYVINKIMQSRSKTKQAIFTQITRNMS